jgi:hypothetical protein
LCWQKKHEDDDMERMNTQHGALLDSFNEDELLQAFIRSRLQIKGGGDEVVMGMKSLAATKPPMESGAAGRVSVGGEADHLRRRARMVMSLISTWLVMTRGLFLRGHRLHLLHNEGKEGPVDSAEYGGTSLFLKAMGNWRAQSRVEGVQKHLGCFDDEEAATRAYDKAAIERGMLDWLNFADYDLQGTASSSPAPRQISSQFRGVSWHAMSSQFRGVSWHAMSRNWRAQIYVEGVQKCIGCFDNEEAAARAYDRAAIECGRLDKLNFDDYVELHETAEASLALPAPQQGSNRF